MHQYARLGFRSGRSGRNTRDPKSSPLYEKFHHPAFLLLSTLLYFHLLVLTRTPFSLAGGSRDRSRTIRISSPTAGYMDKNKLGGGTRSVLASNFGRILSPSCHRSRSSHFPHPPPIRVPSACTRVVSFFHFFLVFLFFCFIRAKSIRLRDACPRVDGARFAFRRCNKNPVNIVSRFLILG